MDIQPSRLSGKALVAAAFFIGFGIFASGAAKAYSDYALTSFTQRSLSASGTASRTLTSDRVKWSLRLMRRQEGPASSTNPATFEAQLKADIDQVVRSLEAAGVRNPTVSRQPYQDSSNYGYYGEPNTANRSGVQTVVIESDQVKALNSVTGDIVSSLASGGTVIDQNTTEFFLSNRDQLRRELTIEAVEDARKQGELLSGNRLGKVIRMDGGATMNVTPVNSYSPSYYNESDDTSSVEKKVTLNLVMTYSLK